MMPVSGQDLPAPENNSGLLDYIPGLPGYTQGLPYYTSCIPEHLPGLLDYLPVSLALLWRPSWASHQPTILLSADSIHENYQR